MNKRTYGMEPYHVVVLHGGPGGIGDVKNLATFIASFKSVLEPFMIEKTLDDQLKSLKYCIRTPSIIVGYSWGAMMAILFAHQFPHLVKKLVFIGCPPLDVDSAQSIMETRLKRLDKPGRHLLNRLLTEIKTTHDIHHKQKILMQIKALDDKTDLFNPIAFNDEHIDCRVDVYESLWPQTSRLRNEGLLIEAIKQTTKPVVFIHGTYDPHPIEAILRIQPYMLAPNKLYALKRCGHTPWLEKDAMEEFFDILKRELQENEACYS